MNKDLSIVLGENRTVPRACYCAYLKQEPGDFYLEGLHSFNYSDFNLAPRVGDVIYQTKETKRVELDSMWIVGEYPELDQLFESYQWMRKAFLARPLKKLGSLLCWEGKVFEAEEQVMILTEKLALALTKLETAEKLLTEEQAKNKDLQENQKKDAEASAAELATTKKELQESRTDEMRVRDELAKMTAAKCSLESSALMAHDQLKQKTSEVTSLTSQLHKAMQQITSLTKVQEEGRTEERGRKRPHLAGADATPALFTEEES